MALLRRARRACALTAQQGWPGNECEIRILGAGNDEVEGDKEGDDEKRKEDGPTGGKAMGTGEEDRGPDYGSTINVVCEKILSFRYKKLEDYELEEKVEN